MYFINFYKIATFTRQVRVKEGALQLLPSVSGCFWTRIQRENRLEQAVNCVSCLPRTLPSPPSDGLSGINWKDTELYPTSLMCAEVCVVMQPGAGSERFNHSTHNESFCVMVSLLFGSTFQIRGCRWETHICPAAFKWLQWCNKQKGEAFIYKRLLIRIKIRFIAE